MSQPPKVGSFNSARGTNFLMSGEGASVCLRRRMVPICVSDPTGSALPLRTSSTPGIKVVLTAPMPGSRTPSFPLAGAILEGFSILLLLLTDRNTVDGKNELETRIAAAEACCVPKQTSNDEGRPQDLQIGAGKITPQSQLNQCLMAQKSHPAAVDIQDNRASIRYFREPPPGLKWERQVAAHLGKKSPE